MMSHCISFFTALFFALLANSFHQWMRQWRDVNKKKLVDKNCMGVDRTEQNLFGRQCHRAQRTKIWLIHGLWTKPLVHGLPWTCQAVLSQWLQQRNFQTMDLEDPASRSTSSSSSNSASSSESLFAVFDPSSTPALFSSSYSASQHSAASAVKWVDRSGNKNWDSPLWDWSMDNVPKKVHGVHGPWTSWRSIGPLRSYCFSSYLPEAIS